MLRELVDIALHEDFVRGLARSIGLRVGVYDAAGGLIAAADPMSEFGQLSGCGMETIPAGQMMTSVPAHDPPDCVAFVENGGVWYVAAPVYMEDDQRAGWVAVGEFRERITPDPRWREAAISAGGTLSSVTAAWQRLPLLNRSGSSQVVIAARWGARLLSEWCRRESRLLTVTEEAALVGDIAGLQAGREDLQTILDRIVADTARVMKCRYCSLRLYDPETGELRIKAVHNLSKRYLRKGAVLRAQNPIDDEALTGELVYVEDVAIDPRIQYPEQMRQEGIVSQLTAGMMHHGQPIGVIRVYTDHRQLFRPTQRNMLWAVAHQAATAIAHARLMEERLRSVSTERQLALAGELQARMMRIPPPRHDDLAIASEYHPCSHLGGDFCDIFTLCDGRLALVVADVVGKGIPAALLSASIRGALCAHGDSCDDLGELLTRLNRQVCIETLPSEFVTLLVIAVDVEHRRLGYCNAGHESLLLLRAGQVRRLSEGGLVLGLEPDEIYQERTSAVHPNDLFLLYTDGAVEAMNFDGELFGRRRLVESLRQFGDLAVDQVLHNIIWDVRRFVGLAEQSDDLTMIGLRVLE